MQLVTQYGTMWARNSENINRIPGSRAGGVGVYLLFDGSMPVYVGKGNIKSRIKQARRSKRRGQLWDRFSWYALSDPAMTHDLEVLILRILPPYLRALTKQGGNFKRAVRVTESKNKKADPITRKWRRR